MGDQAVQERRLSKRAKSIKRGQIVYQDGKCLMDCIIFDLSHAGARIRPADLIKCPPWFVLRITDGDAHPCIVVHRFGADLGVRFLDRQPEARSIVSEAPAGDDSPKHSCGR
jgi:hypothetical protein